MSFLNLFISRAVPTCFDGEGDPLGTPPAAPPAAPPVAPPAAEHTPPVGEGKTFTQEDVNKFLAEDRRKHQAALLKTEQTYKELLATNSNLSTQERKALEENLAVVQGQLRTKEETAKLEKKQLEEQYNTKLTEAQKKAEEWEKRYRSETVVRSLQDAAAQGDAFRAEQIVSLLQPMAKMVEETDASGRMTGNFNIVIEFPDIDSQGQPMLSTFTPVEAVKRMRELPEIYGNLFKANVVSGIGSNSTTGLQPGSNGKVDLKRLAKDPVAFRKALKDNPELIGLRRGPR